MKREPKLYLHQSKSGEPNDKVSRVYDDSFRVDEAYRESMPDIMDAVDSMQGSAVPIQQVGVSNFRLPLRYQARSGEVLELETSVVGTVSLEANLKGINMSRIMRSFYEGEDVVFTPANLKGILDKYRERIGSFEARLALRFRYPILQESLRSGLRGYQYYDCVYEATLSRSGELVSEIRLDFVYSSACPCSAELAEHAREERGKYTIPHSQRSKARVWVRLASAADFFVEDLRDHCLAALKTETQVLVKREDEQAFAELNGAYIKFVEDAARLVFEQLNGDERIADFQVACSHLESLHSHDAVSVICKGVPGGYRADFLDFNDLVC